MGELDLQENQLTTLLGLGELRSLKRLLLSGNQLTSLEGLDAPSLTNLELSKNQLTSTEHIVGAPECVELDLRENQFDAGNPQIPELRRLSVDTPKLRILHLAGNAALDGTFGEALSI